MADVRYEILGPLRAFRGEHELDLGPAKQRAVLAALLVNAGRPISVSRIIDAAWPDDPPANGANVVQKYVGGLRKVLEPERSPRAQGRLLRRNEAGYQLQVAPGRLDALLFRDLHAQARAALAGGKPADCSATAAAALRLWRGEPLSGLSGLSGPVFQAEVAHLAQARADAYELWAEAELQLGQHDRLVPGLSRLVAEFPGRERLRYLQMLALYRCGRQVEALEAYRSAHALLTDEYGVEPGPELRELHQAVLRNDPALSAPPAGPTPSPPPQGTAWAPPDALLAHLPPTFTRPLAESRRHLAGSPPANLLPNGHPHPPGSRPNGLPPLRPADAPPNRPNDAPPNRPHDAPPNWPHDTPPNWPHDTPPDWPHDAPPDWPHDVPPDWPHDAPLKGPHDGPQDRRYGSPPGSPWSRHPDRPPDRPSGGRARGWGWLAALALIGVPLFTMGLATWVVFALLAAHRRSRVLGLAAACYGLLTAFAFVAIDTSNMEGSTGLLDDLGILAMLATMLGGAVHSVTLIIRR